METYGSMEKKERVEFILEQMRLCLAVKDYIRTQIISKKINTKFFQEENTEVSHWRTFFSPSALPNFNLICLFSGPSVFESLCFLRSSTIHGAVLILLFATVSETKAEILQLNDPAGSTWRLLPLYLQTLQSHLWYSVYPGWKWKVAAGKEVLHTKCLYFHVANTHINTRSIYSSWSSSSVCCSWGFFNVMLTNWLVENSSNFLQDDISFT